MAPGFLVQRVHDGDGDPRCLACGILKSAAISFGQNLVAAGLVPLAARCGAAVVIVNGQATPMDELADAVVRRPISDALPELIDPA